VSVRTGLLRTAEGSITDAFTWREWRLLACIAGMWGPSFLFIDVGLDAFRPGVVALARLALGASALTLVPQARHPIDRADIPRVMLLGAVWMAIPMVMFPVAQQWIDSSVAGMLNGAMPLTTALWATVLLRRLPGPRQLIGLTVGFAGVVAITSPELAGSRATGLGAGLVLVAVSLYGLGANLAVPLQQRYGSLPVLLRAQLTALGLIIPFGVAHLSESAWSWTSAAAMLPLGILGTGVAFVLLATLVGGVGSTRGSVAVYFLPPVAIILGVVVRGDALAPIALVGTALVLAGAWLTSRRDA
jgi:drug/metabolite transporter (DMT)-like permease